MTTTTERLAIPVPHLHATIAALTLVPKEGIES